MMMDMTEKIIVMMEVMMEMIMVMMIKKDAI